VNIRLVFFSLNWLLVYSEWRPFAHVAIAHQPLTALEQWKASKHRLVWVAVVNRNVGKWNVYSLFLSHWKKKKKHKNIFRTSVVSSAKKNRLIARKKSRNRKHYHDIGI